MIVRIMSVWLIGAMAFAAAVPPAFGWQEEQPLPDQVKRLNERATALHRQGKLDEAIPFARECLAEVKRLRGGHHADYAAALNNLAMLLYAKADYAAAEPLLREVLEVRRNAGGGGHPDYAVNLSNLARLLVAKGDYAGAEPLYREALEVRRKALGEEDENYAGSLSDLGGLMWVKGDHAAAEPLFRRSLEIWRKSLGEEHPLYATGLNNLAMLLRTRGDYAAAEPLYRECLDVTRKSLGEDHPDYATSLNNLALLLQAKGDQAAAEPLLRDLVEVRRRTVGDAHPDYALSLNNLAFVLRLKGDYAGAEPLYREALKVRRAAQGETHPAYATGLHNLADLLRAKADYAAAEPLYREAIEIKRKTVGTAHPEFAMSLNDLALLLQARGDYGGAEPLYRQALEVTRKALGEEHPQYATGLNNLAGMLSDKGDHTAGVPLLREALELRRRALGEDHPEYASSLSNLALLLRRQRDYAAAEPLFRQAVEVWRRTRREDHPDHALTLQNLAGLLVAVGRPAEAVEFQAPAWRLTQERRRRMFDFSSERAQVAYAASVAGTLDASLSLAAEHLPGDAAARRLAAEVVLSSKAAMLESLAARRATSLAAQGPELRALLAEWQAAGRRLTQASLAVPAPAKAEAHRRALTDLASAAEDAERRLAGASASFASQRRTVVADLRAVAAALPAGSALVEFTRYESRRFDDPKEPWGERQYLALVIKGGQGSMDEPQVSLVPLGPAARIDDAVARWRRLFAGEGGRGFGKPEPAAADQADPLAVAGASLAGLVWNPVSAEIEGCRRVFVSPDAALSFVPFAALPGRKAGSFVLDEYDVGYLATGRDLVRASITDEGGPPLLVGSPEYGQVAGAATPPTTRATAEAAIADIRAFDGARFDPLPGALAEVEALEKLLRAAGREPAVLTGTAATESAVTRVRQPVILHLATHGFFLPDSGLVEAIGQGQSGGVGAASNGHAAATARSQLHLLRHNPMQRSGVALAGANATLTRRQSTAGEDDGILTADEVAGMDLWGTRLVTISACESGLGEARGGEGVYGLRRAFALAGAANLVTSMWKVDDAATARLMSWFYEGVAQGVPPLEALLTAQRRHVASRRGQGEAAHPYYWAAFTCSGSGTVWRTDANGAGG